jgi:hypothetical protein
VTRPGGNAGHTLDIMRYQPGTAGASYPLSASQLPLWFIDGRQSNRAQQAEGCLLWVRGEVAASRLRDVISGLVTRHPALRIGFERAAGSPRQRVHATVDWTLAETDLREMPPERAHAEATRWGTELAAGRFDLEKPPLWHAGAARLPGGRSLIVVAAHHLICDGWTVRLILGEMGAEYGPGRPGSPEPGPAAPYPQCLLDRDRAWSDHPEVTAYWRAVLARCEAPAITVPGASPAAGGGTAVRASVPAGMSRLVRAVARQHRVTPFLVFAAAYAATVARFSGTSVVPVASAFHGRPAPGLKGVAGLFATMLVLRADLAGDPSFAEFLARMRQTYRDCLAHQNATLEELALERPLSRAPFFRHVISYHPASFAVSAFGGMPADMDLVSGKPTPNELEFHVRELADSFALQLRFDPAVLDAGSAQVFLSALSELLASLVADPERRVTAVRSAR